MSHQRQQSLSVPFSWENQPGISKVAPRSDIEEEESLVINGPGQKPIKLPPPPPCSSDSPKGPFFRRSSGAKGFRRDEDPFLVAYMECTKSVKKQGKKGTGKERFGLSCKSSSPVREDTLVRISKRGESVRRERLGNGDGRGIYNSKH